MASIIPVWLTGPGLSNVTVTGLTRATDGTLAAGTSRAITFQVNSVKNSVEQHTEEISSVNTYADNEVPIGQGSGIDLEVILKSKGQRNDLADLAKLYSYMEASFTSGVGANAKTWDHIGPWKLIEDGIVSKGKNLARMTVGQVAFEDGTVNPTYS